MEQEPLTDAKGTVAYEHVSFHYSDDDTPVLSDVSFEIPADRSAALLGLSWCGSCPWDLFAVKSASSIRTSA